MAYIEFKDVTRAYGSGGAEVHALDGASFEVERGTPTETQRELDLYPNALREVAAAPAEPEAKPAESGISSGGSLFDVAPSEAEPATAEPATEQPTAVDVPGHQRPGERGAQR